MIFGKQCGGILAGISAGLLGTLVVAATPAQTPTVIVSTHDEALAQGPFEPTWESLAHYQVPDWFRDAKFGLWAHWGPQCAPEDGDWYARNMYTESGEQYKYQLAHYGHPSKVGFKDVIHTWKAEKWDPEKLLALYKRAGAQYFFALANHHDNFDNWDSKYQPWNSVKIGPQKDLIDGWAKAARDNGLRFGVSVHAAHAWSWYEVAQGADKKGPLAGVSYDGKLTTADGKGQWWDGLDPQDLYAQNHTPGIKLEWGWDASKGSSTPDAAYCQKFYNRTMNLMNKYHPDMVYFDDHVLPLWPVSDCGLKIAAHLYNSSIKQNGGKNEAVLFGKMLNPEQRKCMVWDIERGVSDEIEPLPWQTDTCIGGWHYQKSIFEQHKYKSAKTVVQTLADIVSKNGNLLLSIPVKSDGTIDADETAIVEGIAAWMDVNRECIFGTRPFKVCGEGPALASGRQGTLHWFQSFPQGDRENRGRIVRSNYHGRPGQLPDLTSYTRQWLDAAAQLGDGKDPDRFQPQFAEILLALYPNDKVGAKYQAAGIRPDFSLLQGHLTMNIGALACHRRDRWLASVGGLSPVTGKHEIYSWTQINNYSLYAKRGSLLLIDPSYSSRDNQQGYALSGGFDWSFIPGVTCPATPDYRLLVRRDRSYIQNAGMAGGCTMDEDGIWGLDQVSGPGPLFKKSAFFFGGRITMITTSITYPEKEKAAAPTPGERTVHTTLFQWPLAAKSNPLSLNGKEQAGFPWETTAALDRFRWLVDSRGHGYVIHPAPKSTLAVRRSHQSFTICNDEFLKDRANNPLDLNNMIVKNLGPMNDQNVLAVQSFYTPRTGDFELAFLDHSASDGSQNASCVFDVLPLAGAEKAQALCTSLQDPASSPYTILQQDASAHVLCDRETQVTGYVVFAAGSELPAGPLKTISAPGCLMLKPAGGLLRVSAASPTSREAKTTKITFRGAWRLSTPVPGLATDISVDRLQTVVTWNQPNHLPVLFTLQSQPGQ